MIPSTDPNIRTFDQGGIALERSAKTSCPSCQYELRFATLEGCKFAGCVACGGMLIQQDVFGMLIMHLRSKHNGPSPIPSPMNPAELRVTRVCTACDTKMETHPYAGPGNSVIDSCPSCHLIWFDAGELTKLVEAPGRRFR